MWGRRRNANSAQDCTSGGFQDQCIAPGTPDGAIAAHEHEPLSLLELPKGSRVGPENWVWATTALGSTALFHLMPPTNGMLPTTDQWEQGVTLLGPPFAEPNSRDWVPESRDTVGCAEESDNEGQTSRLNESGTNYPQT